MSPCFNTWSTIKEILNKCKDKKDFPAFFTLNGENIEDKTEISNTFNNFFASVGANLSNSIEYNVIKTFLPFLNKGLYHPLILNVSAILMWRKLLKILHQRTVLVKMVLSAHFLKIILETVTLLLTHIINPSLCTGIFPDRLKIAKVVPLFENGWPTYPGQLSAHISAASCF